jgi:replicative DNA helicase
MVSDAVAPASRGPQSSRLPPHSEEAERGVLGSILLDAARVLDLCVERQIRTESFYVPAHRLIYEVMLDMAHEGRAVDLLTVSDKLNSQGKADSIGGITTLERLVDSTPTAAHAEFYIDLVRQKHLLRCILTCCQEAENQCYGSEETADSVLDRTEQAFLDITERGQGSVPEWSDAVKSTMGHIEKMLQMRRGLSGISTGFADLDKVTLGLKPGEMIVLAARPSMGKTSLAMNLAENVALGRRDPDHATRPVGIFSLEMSQEALVMRMLASHAGVSSHKLVQGFAQHNAHALLTQAASVLSKAPVFLDDTSGLDVIEVRARARRMKKKYGIELVVIDYLQMLQSREMARQGKQVEVAHISGNLKAMAKELKVPVLVLSQLSRAPEQREKTARPKLSDLRDSGAIEQDADVVWLLRRPCKYPEDERFEDKTLAIVDIAKNRNGPTGEVELNFEEDYARFADRVHGVDDAEPVREDAQAGLP